MKLIHCQRCQLYCSSRWIYVLLIMPFIPFDWVLTMLTNLCRIILDIITYANFDFRLKLLYQLAQKITIDNSKIKPSYTIIYSLNNRNLILDKITINNSPILPY